MNEEAFDFDSALGRYDGNYQLLQDMIKFFREDAPALMLEIEQGIQSSDLPTVRRASHSMKGLAASIGAVRLPQLAAEVETLATNDELAQIQRKSPELRQLVENAVGQLASGLPPPKA